MHSVDREEEPDGLGTVRKKLTPKWVGYYRHGKGKKPADSRWREFQPDLSRVFFDQCGYCEEFCKGEVDHFRPKSRDPELVYVWSNWVLACHTCNATKRQQWPSGGYVDPCAKTRAAQPEAYFEFDTKTGHILPKPGLSSRRRKKASQMIDDLGLNLYIHLKKRIQWLTAVETGLARDDPHDPDDPDHGEFIHFVASRKQELSSITRAFLKERGFPVAEEA